MAFFPLAAAALIVVGYTLPFWVTDIDGVRTSGLDFSTDVGSSWPILGAAGMVVVGAADRVRGAIGGIAFAAGPLVQWSGLLWILVATTEEIRGADSPNSYGPGAIVWMIALVPAMATIVASRAEAVLAPSPFRASPGIGTAVGLGGAVWLGALVLPGEGDRTLLGGPLLADLGRLWWVAGVAVAVYLAATRRTPGALALVVGQAAAWTLWWGDSGDPASLASVFEPWAHDTFFGLGCTVAGTAAALGMVRAGFDAARAAPEGTGPPVSIAALIAVVLIPLFGLAGFAG